MASMGVLGGLYGAGLGIIQNAQSKQNQQDKLDIINATKQAELDLTAGKLALAQGYKDAQINRVNAAAQPRIAALGDDAMEEQKNRIYAEEGAKAGGDFSKLYDMDTKDRELGIKDKVAESQIASEKAKLQYYSQGRKNGFTLPQLRTNYGILSARKAIEGMSPEEILHKTQSTTTTGRNNPDYDPSLARTVRLARTRLYGDDPDFEAILQGGDTGQSAVDIASRFSSDSAMKGFRLGNATGDGFEVFDGSGKLVGHYQ